MDLLVTLDNREFVHWMMRSEKEESNQRIIIHFWNVFRRLYNLELHHTRSHWHCFWNRCLEGKFDLAFKPII